MILKVFSNLDDSMIHCVINVLSEERLQDVGPFRQEKRGSGGILSVCVSPDERH